MRPEFYLFRAKFLIVFCIIGGAKEGYKILVFLRYKNAIHSI